MIHFHGYFRSSSSHRVRIAFNLKGVGYDFTPVHLRKDGGQHRKPEYLHLNPQGLVPLVQDGAFRLSQSLAIIEWLEETHPSPPLLPTHPNERAQIRAFSQIIACDIHPLQNLRVLEALQVQYGADQESLRRWCQRWIGDGLRSCEALIEQRPPSTFAFGEAPSLADVCLVPQFVSAERFGVDTAAFNRLTRVVTACGELPAFALAHPSRQPDAE